MSHVLTLSHSKCQEGTAILPNKFKPCCESFERRTLACEFDIRIEWLTTTLEWGLRCMDGSHVVIKHCPFCGVRLAVWQNMHGAQVPETQRSGIRVMSFDKIGEDNSEPYEDMQYPLP